MLIGMRRRSISRLSIEPCERRLLLATSVIDLAVVYNAGAIADAGSESLLRSHIQQSVDATNFAMNNSRIDVAIRIVRMEQIAYVGSGDLYIDRTRLANPSDGFLDSVHTLRNTYGADLVMLVTESDFFGGNADLMTGLTAPDNATRAFSAIEAHSLGANNYTVAHELGHNLGAGHERDNPSQPVVGPFSYSVGYRFTAAGRTYHDIMSYDPGIGVPYYANPAVSYLGSPTGAPIGSVNEADLATTFAQTAPIVASYRSTVVQDTTAPLAQVDSIGIRNGFAYVSMLYLDDGGINLSTIGTGDITLAVPDLPTLTPVLDSIENAAVGGAFKRATYRAYLRDASVDIDAVMISLGSNQIRNLSNLPATAGIVPRATAHTAGWSFSDARQVGALDGELLFNGAQTDADSNHLYRFTLDSTRIVNLRLSHLATDVNVYLAKDVNGDGIYQGETDFIEGSFRTGVADETIALSLAAGEYFAWVYLPGETPYTLTLRSYTDTVAPTATLDARDITSPTNQFVFNVIYHDNQEMSALTTRYYSPVRLTNPWGGYYIYFADEIDVDANGSTRIVTYRVNAGFTLSAGDNGVYTVSMEPADSPVFNPALNRYVGDAAGNRVATTGTLGTFRVAIAQTDITAPAAVGIDAKTIQRGGATTYDFDVTYTDNRDLDSTSLATGKVRVTGPAGFNVLADPISVSAAPAIGSRRTVRYRVAAPGGTWDFTDRGTYSVSTVANQIKDAAGNFAGIATVGTFSANIPIPGDADRNGRVEFDDLLTIAQNYGLTGKSFAQGNFNDDEAGNVGFDDLLLVAQHYGQSNAVSAPSRRRSVVADAGIV